MTLRIVKSYRNYLWSQAHLKQWFVMKNSLNTSKYLLKPNWNLFSNNYQTANMNDQHLSSAKPKTEAADSVSKTRLYLLKAVKPRKRKQMISKIPESAISGSSSDDSLPRLLKYCRDKSGSKSFENDEEEFGDSSLNLDPDEEYFSCDNTGASSPSQLQREGVIVPKEL